MFNSIVLDTVIGLVFIYLLYSLMTTILGEMVANWIGLRARMLRQAIERLLNDDYQVGSIRKEIRRIRDAETKLVKPANSSFKEQARPILHMIMQLFVLAGRLIGSVLLPVVRGIGSFLLFEFEDFNTSTAGLFYSQPSVKYLSKGPKKRFSLFRKAKPSYIRTENFSDTVIQMFKAKGTGETVMDEIGFCLKYNTLHIQPETLGQMKNMYTDSDMDLEKFRKKLDDWYNEMMERLGGWFKRKIQLILFLLGLIIAITFNVDSIAIVKKLAKDKNAREQMVQLATRESQAGSATATALQRSQDSTVKDSLLRESYHQVKQATDDAGKILGLGWDLPKLIKPCSTNFLNTTLIACWNYTVKKPRCASVPGETMPGVRFNAMLQEWFLDSISYYRKDLAKAKGDSLKKAIASMMDAKSASLDEYISALNYFGETEFVALKKIERLDRKNSLVLGERPYSNTEKVGYVLAQTWQHKLVLLGFIITALAVSLGSNFWFDLLKKLVSIRGSGANPDESKAESKKDQAPDQSPDQGGDGGAGGGGAGAAAQAPMATEDPGDIAMRIYGDEIRQEPGVLEIGKGYSKPADGPAVRDRLQVSVDNEDTAVRVRSKYGRLRISESEYTDVDILITDKPKISGGPVSTAANRAKGLANANELFGWGSFGCLVHNKFEPGRKFILSCYHVMNGNYTWNNDGKDRSIKNAGKTVSDRYQGFLNNSLDIAYAEISGDDIEFYKNGIPSRKPVMIREVTVEDVYKCQVTIEGMSTGTSRGMIVNDSKPVTFNYSSGPRQYFSHQIDDLIVINHKDLDHPEYTGTKDGDSGSVVLDDDDNAIGIVVGCDLIHTYAIRIKTIFDLLGMELEV